ncbi:MAG: hypothetical protein KIT84_40600 [Labilithrix sp.]|nr:hypothetical protein [Labilithrix sp.]MCW5817369.1 hypothetical protein [Labilithrix sp.]
MLLFTKRFHAGLVDGSVTVTFRRWDKPHVKVGGRYRCHPIGVLEVEAIEQVKVRAIAADDARRAGFATRAELLAFMAAAPKREEAKLTPATLVYKVTLRHGGDGDRVEIALDDALTAEDVTALRGKLAKMDAKGPWTKATLALIAKHPRVAASKLAAMAGRETAPFKVDVRRLKKLGLTQSFEVGYEISPRGRAFLGWR